MWITDSKRFNALTKLRKYCECGHSMTMYHNYDYCSWCGKIVFKNKKEEFKYKLNLALKKT